MKQEKSLALEPLITEGTMSLLMRSFVRASLKSPPGLRTMIEISNKQYQSEVPKKTESEGK